MPDSAWSEIFGMNKPELIYIVGGSICACMVGFVQPLFAVIFSEILVLFSEFENDPVRVVYYLS